MLQNWTAAIVNKVYVARGEQSLIGHHGNHGCCWSLREEETTCSPHLPFLKVALFSIAIVKWTFLPKTMQGIDAEGDGDFFFPSMRGGNRTHSFHGGWDLVVDRVTTKLRDLDSSELKAVELITKHSASARRGAVGSQQTIFFLRHLPRNWLSTRITFLLWIWNSNYFQFAAYFITPAVVYFQKTQMERVNC